MNRIIIVLCSFFVSVCVGQNLNKTELNEISLEELNMASYEKNPTVSALILEERGIIKMNTKGDHLYTKKYYLRMKIFNTSAYNYATVEIPFYKNNKVENINAVSYNLVDGKIEKSILTDKNINREKYSKSVKIKSFAIPNVKVGSVIEYSYDLKTNNYGVYDWYFQSETPKLTSSYKADLSGKIKYNVRMIGFLKPDIDSAFVKKRCYGVYKCLSLHYEMNNVPAFVEEKYISNKKNYISRLFVEREYVSRYKKKDPNNKWEKLDHRFKLFYDKYYNKAAYFKRKLPSHLLNGKKDLVKAIEIYTYIQNLFTKDNNNLDDLDRALKRKIANSTQINKALYYSLKSAKYKTNLVYVSTRSHGIATKLHATTVDFDDTAVLVRIEGKEYFLDASVKNQPFGMVPFDFLNGDGRVLDFIQGSYWKEIKSTQKSETKIKADLKLVNDSDLNGEISIIRTGYDAFNKREEIRLTNNEIYLEKIESNDSSLEIVTYNNENLKAISEPLIENYSVNLENDNDLKISPFVFGRLTENPFKLNKRDYPVDFGYAFGRSYFITITIPDGYKVKSLPKNKSLRLPKGGGNLLFNVNQSENKVIVYLKFKLNKKIYLSNEYLYLKEFYNQLIKIQDSFIEFEK